MTEKLLGTDVEWIVSGDGGSWHIHGVNGEVIAYDIPHGYLADEITESHNQRLVQATPIASDKVDEVIPKIVEHQMTEQRKQENAELIRHEVLAAAPDRVFTYEELVDAVTTAGVPSDLAGVIVRKGWVTGVYPLADFPNPTQLIVDHFHQ